MPTIAGSRMARLVPGQVKLEPRKEKPDPVSRIELVTRIAAPPERCFDLSRSLELHMRSTSSIAERLVLDRYLHRFLVARNAEIKAIAESRDWERYMPAS